MPSPPPSLSGTSGSSGTSGTPGISGELTEVDLLMRLARRWRSLGLQEAAEHGLSPHQERALLGVARLLRRAEQEHADHDDGRDARGQPAHPGVRMSHLAHHLGIAPRSATEVADALEAAGLVGRSPDPSDRRAVLLTLTDEGRRAVARVRDRRRAAADEAVSTLSSADRAELRRLLEALLGGS